MNEVNTLNVKRLETFVDELSTFYSHVINIFIDLFMSYANFQKQKSYDKLHSTYRWAIMLDNNYIFHGYSKKEGFSEPKDKIYCFQSCMFRILKAYISKSYHIEFYRREGLSNDTDTLILEVMPKNKENTYTFHGAFFDVKSKNIIEEIMQKWQFQSDFDYLKPVPSRSLSVEIEDFHYKIHTILAQFPEAQTEREALFLYCEVLKNKGYTRNRVEAYFHKFMASLEGTSSKNSNQVIHNLTQPFKPV